MTTKATAKASKRVARIAGMLYIIGTIGGMLSLVCTAPIRDAQDLVDGVVANQNQMIAGALFVLMMGLALAMVPVVVFPILRKHNEVLALGYVVFRSGLEGVTYIGIAVSWLLLLPLSQMYVEAGASDVHGLEALAHVLMEGDEIGTILTIVFVLGALMFYYVLYRSRLIPRWISGWGLVAAIPYLAVGLLHLFDLVAPYSTVGVLLELPLALQEMVMAVWLIAKGFRPSAVSASAQ
jgi:hypothetical protein